ncbi:MAG: leucyl aminopeptidase [Mycobacteriales bacterium]
MTTLSLTSAAPLTLPVDAIVVGVATGPAGLVLAAGTGSVDTALAGGLADALAALGATGRLGEVTTTASHGALPAPVIAAVGLGDVPAGAAGYAADMVRLAAGAAARTLFGRDQVAMTLASVNGPTSAGLVAAAGEGALLGSYDFAGHRGADAPERPAPPRAFSIVVDNPKDKACSAAVRRADLIAAGVAVARDLVNAAPNEQSPAALAGAAAAAGKAAGVDVEILDEKALAKAGYGGVLAVGGGSSRPPRLVRMHYKPGRSPRAHVALVGKGITFDSGGISLKEPAQMEDMKSDMAGAAAVIATICAAATLKLPVEIAATVPMAENLPGPTSYRPADVLTMYGGRRVEVLNTDAEGRLILADAIVRAGEDSPDYLIDVATLTGAQIVALGRRTTGVLGTDDLRDRVVAGARACGDPAWPMPIPAEARGQLESTWADIANTAGADRSGGMLVAAAFLRDFVPAGLPWAHLDVAGPAYNTGEAWGCTPKGGTGVPVRTLLATLTDIAATPANSPESASG